jgi:hypothetical protein
LHPLVLKKLIASVHFDRAHFVLSSPWIVSRLACVSENFKEDVLVKRSTIAALVQKEQLAASRLFATGDSTAIDTKLFEVKINGYPVTQYEGKKARSVEGTLAISFASRKLMNDMKSRVSSFFHVHAESFHSATFLRYVALRSIMPAHTDYAWLEVHGDLTDICLVREGACAMGGSLPFGSDTLVRKFAHLADEAESTAVSALNALEKGTGSAKAHQSAQENLNSAMAEWLAGLKALMSTGGETLSSPTIYVSAERHGFAFVEALKASMPDVSVRLADESLMVSFVERAPSAHADLSAALYAAALPLSSKL